MSQLYKVCNAKTKIWKDLPNGKHNDSILEPGYFDYIADFINDNVLGGS